MSRQTPSTAEVFAEDHYATLGVVETASGADIRRAYRLLALQWHPDRAGPTGAERFVRIAAAYAVLANARARAEYDVDRRRRAGVAAGAARGTRYEIRFGPDGRPEARVRRVPDLLAGLSGPIDRLVAAGRARVLGDGTIEIYLQSTEMENGGTAVIEMPLTVRCSLCGGVARPQGVWCRRCEHAGVVVEPVAVHVPVPANVPPGSEYRALDGTPLGTGRPLSFRFQRRQPEGSPARDQPPPRK